MGYPIFFIFLLKNYAKYAILCYNAIRLDYLVINLRFQSKLIADMQDATKY